MSSQWNRPLIEMLEDAGCKRLPSKNHLKYRLPSGQIFVTSSTPSAPSSINNALARIRRELRPTHPEIADRGRPQRSFSTNTIGDLLEAKGIDPIVAVGGEVTQVDFQILDTDPEETMPSVQSDHNSTHFPHLPRVEKDPRRMNGTVKTYPSEILAEASRIEMSEGPHAMSRYLDEHRDSQIVVERHRPIPMDPPIGWIDRPQDRIDVQMNSVIGRARATLVAVQSRLDGYVAKLAELDEIKKAQEADEMKKIQLEEYIQEHERLAVSAASLLEILPPPPAEPLRSHVTHPEAKKRERKSVETPRVPYSMVQAFVKVFPILRQQGKTEFTIAECHAAFESTDLRPLPLHNQVGNWLSLEARSAIPLIEAGSMRGLWRFKNETV